MENEKRSIADIYEDVAAFLKNNDNVLTEELAAESEWFDKSFQTLTDTVVECLKSFPSTDGLPDALFLTLARTSCYFITVVQNNGLMRDGHSMYDVFMNDIMPVAHRMVQEELSEDNV